MDWTRVPNILSWEGLTLNILLMFGPTLFFVLVLKYGPHKNIIVLGLRLLWACVLFPIFVILGICICAAYLWLEKKHIT